MSFADKAKDFANDHDRRVDRGLRKAGDQIDDRTGGKYARPVQKGVDEAQESTGQGDDDR